MRQVILDTETTGIEPVDEHNIIEIGCVEMLDRKLTGRTYHQYILPQREIDEGAFQVHGISNEFLADKPTFVEISAEFIEFIQGAELIIHNAAFDVGFLNSEMRRNGYREKIEDLCPKVTDTLLIARKKFPGQKNNLDALCKRFSIEHFDRELHGALLDSKILAEVYLRLTGGQVSLALTQENEEDMYGSTSKHKPINTDGLQLVVTQLTDEEIKAHEAFLQKLQQASGGQCVWLQSTLE